VLANALARMPAMNRNLQDEYNRWFRMISAS
jgi:hypothetical protein